MRKQFRNTVLPGPPADWSPSSKDAWNKLISALRGTDFFGTARRNPSKFIVTGTVSAPLTLDVNNPEVTVLAHMLGKLLIALQQVDTLDVRS